MSALQAIGFFNAFVGLMLAAAILAYGTGFVVWLVRLGTWPTYRTEAVKIMEWSVVILFVLLVLLAIVQFFQHHPRAGGMIVSLLVVLVILGVIAYVVANSGEKEKKEE